MNNHRLDVNLTSAAGISTSLSKSAIYHSRSMMYVKNSARPLNVIQSFRMDVLLVAVET